MLTIMIDEEALKVIMEKLGKEFREKVATQLMRCEVGGFDWPDGRKAGLLRKTRSRRYPFVATHYGNLIMLTTDIGKAYKSIGR